MPHYDVSTYQNYREHCAASLAKRQQQQIIRSRSVLTPNLTDEPRLNATLYDQHQRDYLNFSSNDYLGLSRHPQLIAIAEKACARYGVGSGGSALVTGYSEVHQHCEQRLAQFFGFEQALLFNSGFAANQALMFALGRRGDRIIADKLCHVSLVEAAHLTGARLQRFAHNDVMQASRCFSALSREDLTAGSRAFIVTEGVFSMEGDSAPLAELSHLANQHNAALIVDDAHGVGIFGHQGRGSCDAQQVKPDILVVTFGKAFGVQGAAILCDELTAHYLINVARGYIYTTLMPAFQAALIEGALSLLSSPQGDRYREQLQHNIRLFHAELSQFLPQYVAQDSGSTSLPQHAIQPLIIGDNRRTLAISEALKQRGIWLSAIRSPTVPIGQARLRITLTAQHNDQQIRELVKALSEVHYEG